MPLHLHSRLGRPAEGRRRRHRSGAALDPRRRPRGAGRASLWHLAGLAGSGRRDLAGPAPARASPISLGGGAGDREPGRVGAGRGVRGPGRHRRAGGGAGGRGRRLRRPRRRRRWRWGSSSAGASWWSAPRRIVAWAIAERHSIATFWSRRPHEGETPSASATSARRACQLGRRARPRACASACWSTCTGARRRADTSRPGSGWPRRRAPTAGTSGSI